MRNSYKGRWQLKLDMCDCEELEIEDFEVMLAAISKMSRPRAEELPAETPVPELLVAKRKK